MSAKPVSRIQDPALKEAIASCQRLHKFRLYDGNGR